MRVLVVEDQKVLADRIAEGLRDQGMAVDVAYDGSTAMEISSYTSFDVIVLDRDLPRVHGDAVCASLVAGPATARILMLTAAAAVSMRIRAVAGPATSCAHTASPCTRGRSRSRTITSKLV